MCGIFRRVVIHILRALPLVCGFAAADCGGRLSDDRTTDTGAASDSASEAPTSCGDVGFELVGGAGPPCDNVGATTCVQSYQAHLRSGVANSVCMDFPQRCAPADRCGSFTDISKCTCGVGPACGSNEACVSDSDASLPTCRCMTR